MTLTVLPATRRIDAEFSESVGGSGHKTRRRCGVELSLCTASGLRGLGEASPIPGFSTESFDDAASALKSLGSFEVTLPEGVRDVRPCIDEAMSNLGVTLACVRFAVETALLDLFSHHLHVTAASALAAGLLDGSLTEPNTVVQTLTLSKLIAVREHQECLAQARRAWSRGYRAFKIKLGAPGEFRQIRPTLAALRDKYGAEVSLRFDPNGGWPLEQLPQLLGELTAFEPEFVEEPASLSSLCRLQNSPVPLALDESLVDPLALSSLLPHRPALKLTAVVIKPGLLGLLRAFDTAVEARKLGLGVVVTHLFDGAVGHAAAISLAQSVGSIHLAHGLAPHSGLLMTPNRRILGLGQGLLRHDPKPGLPLLEVVHC